jgi:BRCA2, oligonucleotide/oligosaccharide-binding, domain 1/BRCA2, helical
VTKIGWRETEQSTMQRDTQRFGPHIYAGFSVEHRSFSDMTKSSLGVFRSAGMGKSITVSAQSLETAGRILECPGHAEPLICTTDEGCADEGSDETFDRSPQHLEKFERMDTDSSISSAVVGFCSAGRGDAIQVTAQSVENAARIMESQSDSRPLDSNSVDCSAAACRETRRRPLSRWNGNAPTNEKTAPCSSSIVFRSAGRGDAIQLSAQSLEKAARILECSNDSRPFYGMDVGCTASREESKRSLSCGNEMDRLDMDSSASADVVSFRSAGRGDAIQVSAQSLENAARIMEFRGGDRPRDSTNVGHDDAPLRENRKRPLSCCNADDQVGIDAFKSAGIIGFCSAGRGDAIQVSKQSLERAARIMECSKESEPLLCTNTGFSDATDLSSHRRPRSCLYENEQTVRETSQVPLLIAFRSAGRGDAINVSAESLEKAAQILECTKDSAPLQFVNDGCSYLPSRECDSRPLNFMNGVVDAVIVNVTGPSLGSAQHSLEEAKAAEGLISADPGSLELISKKPTSDLVPASNTFSFIGYSQETVLSTEYLEKTSRSPGNKTCKRLADSTCEKSLPSCKPFGCHSEGSFDGNSSVVLDVLTPDVKEPRHNNVKASLMHSQTMEPPNSCRTSFSTSRLLNQDHSPCKDSLGSLLGVIDAAPLTCLKDVRKVHQSGDPVEPIGSPCSFSSSGGTGDLSDAVACPQNETEQCVGCTTQRSPWSANTITSRVSFSSSCTHKDTNGTSLPSESIRKCMIPHESKTGGSIQAVTPSAIKDVSYLFPSGAFVTPSSSVKIDDFPVSNSAQNISFEEAFSKGVMVTNASECLRLGVLPLTLEVNSTNACQVRFCRESKLPISFAVDGIHMPGDLIGSLPDYKLSLKSLRCDVSLLHDKWYKNHLRWIIWKLASVERSFARYLGGNYLTYDAVVNQLRHRFEKEICGGARPVIRKVLNRDISPSCMIVVCVARIRCHEISQEGSNCKGIKTARYIAEISDGWYSMPALPDAILCEFIEKQKIQVGTKLLISNATITGFEDGIDPLDHGFDSFDPKKSPVLHLRANSTRLARWNSKLGLVPTHRMTAEFDGMLCIKKVSDVFDGGGRIPLIDVRVIKMFPLCFLDRSGKTRILSEAEEAAKIELLESKKQKAMEELAEEVAASCFKVRFSQVRFEESLDAVAHV